MCTIQKTMIPALPAKMHQHKDKPITNPAISRFLLQILFRQILLLRCRSSGTLRSMSMIQSQSCEAFYPLFPFVQRRACAVMYMMTFHLLCMSLMGETPFAMTSTLSNDRLSDNERSPRCTFSLKRCLPR